MFRQSCYDDFTRPFFLSFSPFIIYFPDNDDKSRYASCPRSRAVSVVVFAEALAATYRREKNDCHFMGTRWHCGIYRRWAVAGVAQRGVWAEIAKHIKCACDANANRARDIYIFLTFSTFLLILGTRPYITNVIEQMCTAFIYAAAVKYLWREELKVICLIAILSADQTIFQ